MPSTIYLLLVIWLPFQTFCLGVAFPFNSLQDYNDDASLLTMDDKLSPDANEFEQTIQNFLPELEQTWEQQTSPNFLPMLLLKSLTGNLPIVYVEEEEEEPSDILVIKRFHNRYRSAKPRKRQGRPHGYVCKPTRHDVYNLLLAIHDSQMGNTDRIVTFCNRRRPASAIFTNMRFLGRRK